MRWLLVLLAAAACATEPMTAGDAAREIAETECQRWADCGFDVGISVDGCVDILVNETCNDIDCAAEYTSRDLDACLRGYSTTSCSKYQTVCEASEDRDWPTCAAVFGYFDPCR